MRQVIRTILADDEVDVLEEMHDTLVYQKILDCRIEVVGMARNGEEALEMAWHQQPDIAILDLDMPGLDGLATAKALHRQPKPPKVLLYSGHHDRISMLEALDANIQGYVLKSRSHILLSAVDEIFHGGYRFDPQVFHAMYGRSVNGKSMHWFCALTAREREILTLFCNGSGQAAIAAQLQIGPETVKTHLGHIRKKAACINLAELKRKAVKFASVNIAETTKI